MIPIAFNYHLTIFSVPDLKQGEQTSYILSRSEWHFSGYARRKRMKHILPNARNFEGKDIFSECRVS
jgi:hypothetical protein